MLFHKIRFNHDAAAEMLNKAEKAALRNEQNESIKLFNAFYILEFNVDNN